MPEKSASAMKASGLYFPVTKTYLEGKRTEYGKEKSVRPFFFKVKGDQPYSSEPIFTLRLLWIKIFWVVKLSSVKRRSK